MPHIKVSHFLIYFYCFINKKTFEFSLSHFPHLLKENEDVLLLFLFSVNTDRNATNEQCADVVESGK